MKIKSVLIRFNTNYPKTSDKKWRVLVKDIESKNDYVQHLVDEVELKRPCFTSEDNVTGDDGSIITKFHISTLANDILFHPIDEKQTKAIII